MADRQFEIVVLTTALVESYDIVKHLLRVRDYSYTGLLRKYNAQTVNLG